LTTKRHGGDSGSGEGPRPRIPRAPRITSSHERVLDTTGRGKAKAKGPRGASRTGGAHRPRPASALLAAEAPDRARGVKKARGPVDAAQVERGGPWSVASESARTRATAIAVAALDKKAVGLEILDVAGKVDYADFLVIMTGRSDRHAQALAQGIEEALKKQGVRPVALEGLMHGSWVLMDFGDVVVHVFQDDARRLYDIEGLWLDARRLPVPADGPPTE
jgi:ribosome-associated protein